MYVNVFPFKDILNDLMNSLIYIFTTSMWWFWRSTFEIQMGAYIFFDSINVKIFFSQILVIEKY